MRRAALPALALAFTASGARADDTPAPTPARPATYALPFSLRPAIVPTVVRLDAAIVDTKTGGIVASTLTAGAKVTGGLGVYARGAFVKTSPDGQSGASAVANPAVFGLHALPVPAGWKANAMLGVALPLGQGGGDRPDAKKASAVGAGVYARQAMDNALFAVNYVTPMAGFGVARVADRLTVQLEATILQLVRARGGDVEKDASRLNFTTGVHVGYAVIDPLLVVSAEAHHQRWLSTPAAVKLDGTRREQSTAGIGLRSNIALSGTVTARPGIGYFVPIDAPMSKAEYRAVVVDVPVTF